jgi:hypothetical protein
MPKRLRVEATALRQRAADIELEVERVEHGQMDESEEDAASEHSHAPTEIYSDSEQ